jgi:hypothetical protein
VPQRPKDAAREKLRDAVQGAINAGLHPETVVGFVQGGFAEEPLATVTASQARAALWVMDNSRLTGRKHPDAQAFAASLREQGVDLKAHSEEKGDGDGNAA